MWTHFRSNSMIFINLIFKNHISELQISGHLSPQPSGRRKTWCQDTLCHLSHALEIWSSDKWILKNSIYENYQIWFEMGPHGSIWAHIKTGRSHMAQDHFQTLCDLKKAIKIRKLTSKYIRISGFVWSFIGFLRVGRVWKWSWAYGFVLS